MLAWGLLNPKIYSMGSHSVRSSLALTQQSWLLLNPCDKNVTVCASLTVTCRRTTFLSMIISDQSDSLIGNVQHGCLNTGISRQRCGVASATCRGSTPLSRCFHSMKMNWRLKWSHGRLSALGSSSNTHLLAVSFSSLYI